MTTATPRRTPCHLAWHFTFQNRNCVNLFSRPVAQKPAQQQLSVPKKRCKKRLRNVPRYKTRVQSVAIHIFFCSFTLYNVLDRWCLIFAVVLLKPPLNFLRTILVLQCCIRWFGFHSFMINIIHRNLCSACLNHLFKTQGLGKNEETLVSLFGACYAMMKTKRKKGD